MKNWLLQKWASKIEEVAIKPQRLLMGIMLVMILILLSVLIWQIANDDNCAVAAAATASVTSMGHNSKVNRFSSNDTLSESSELSSDESSNETEIDDLGLNEDYNN